MADVYQYETIPDTVRRQIIHIWRDVLGPCFLGDGYGFDSAPNNYEQWMYIHNAFLRETGLPGLAPVSRASTPAGACEHYLLNADTDGVLNIIDLTFRVIESLASWGDYDRERRGIIQEADDAIGELNFRLKDAGIGYQFVGGELARVDSQFIHSSAVQPALQFLSESGFEGPNEEFRAAHAHYRKREYKDAILDAQNSFESTIKVIGAEAEMGPGGKRNIFRSYQGSI